jgi:hypothetical protein
LQYFKCKNNKTNKIKNVSIYEWDLVKENFTIIDEIAYNKTIIFKETNEKRRT